MITGEQVKEAMSAAGITKVDHHDCGFCGFMTHYFVAEGNLYFNSGCNCSWGGSRPASWGEAASWINMQSNEAVKQKLMAAFGIKTD